MLILNPAPQTPGFLRSILHFFVVLRKIHVSLHCDSLNTTCTCRKRPLKHEIHHPTSISRTEQHSSTDPSLNEGLDWISSLFLQHDQGVPYNNALFCTRKHMKLTIGGYTRTTVHVHLVYSYKIYGLSEAPTHP